MNSVENHFQNNWPVILDGAMGTLLQERGFHLPAPQWSAAVLESQPEFITDIHAEYLRAGASLITTATFRTTPRVYREMGGAQRARDLTYQAVQCAREAIGKKQSIYIAGSVAPLEDCYRPDLVPENQLLKQEHAEQIDWLIDAGVDCLLFETQNTIREAVICSELASERSFPFMVSFVCDKSSTLLSGESLVDAVNTIIPYKPMAVLLNCTQPEIITSGLQLLRDSGNYPLGAYANLGESTPEQGGNLSGIISPEKYLKFVQQWIEMDIALIGGCCGSTPEHIRLIYNLLNGHEAI